MGVKVTGQFEPAGDFSIVDGKDVSGNITGSNISSSGQIEAASIGTNLGSIISGSTPFDRSDVSGSWRGELSSSVYLQNVKTTISGSLGSNATLIRSLTAAGISGSWRGALSGSLNIISGSSTSTGSFGNLRITGNSAFGDLRFDTFPYNSNSNSGQFITLKAQDTSDKAILELASANVSSGNVVGEIHFINRSSGAGFNPIANITSHFSQGLLFKTQYGNNGEKVGIRITEENNAPPEVIIPSGSLEVKGNVSGSSTSTGSFGRGFIADTLRVNSTNSSAVEMFIKSSNTDHAPFIIEASDGIQGFKVAESSNGDFSLTMRDTSGNADIFLHTATHTYFNNNGNFGIGTTSPNAKLEVIGNVSGSSTSTGSFGSVHVPDKIGIGTTAPNSMLHVDGGDIRLSTNKKIYFHDTNDYNYLHFNAGRLTLGYTADAIQIDMNGSSVKTIEMQANSDFRLLGRSNKDIILEPQGTGIVHMKGAISGSSLDVAGNIRAVGDVIAQRYIVSSSVTHLTQSFSSGSTIFGDSSDDTHVFTGSLSVNGNVTLPSTSHKIGIGITPTSTLHVGGGSSRSLLVDSTGGTTQIISRKDGNQIRLLANGANPILDYGNSGGAARNLLITSNNTTVATFTSGGDLLMSDGNDISGSATSTGSFGRLRVPDFINIGSKAERTAGTTQAKLWISGSSGVEMIMENSSGTVNRRRVKMGFISNVWSLKTVLDGGSESTQHFGVNTYNSAVTFAGAVSGITTLTTSGNITAGGNVSGSSTSTGSFGAGHFADKLGIGTVSIPHGGVGGGRLSINGADSNVPNGPALQMTTDSDNYPLFSVLPYAHDNIAVYFDGYNEGGGNKSSDAGSTYRIHKVSDELRFGVDSGVSAGSTATYENILVFDTSKNIEIGGNISGSSTSTGSFGDGHIAGKLGIGTTDIGGGVIGGAKLDIYQAGSHSDGRIKSRANDVISSIGSARGNNRFFSISAGLELMTNSNHPILFSTNVTAGSATPQMILDTSGRLGIGETSPSEKLHVGGNIFATGNISGSSTSTGSFGKVYAVKKVAIGEINSYNNPSDLKLDIKGSSSDGVIVQIQNTSGGNPAGVTYNHIAPGYQYAWYAGTMDGSNGHRKFTIGVGQQPGYSTGLTVSSTSLLELSEIDSSATFKGNVSSSASSTGSFGSILAGADTDNGSVISRWAMWGESDYATLSHVNYLNSTTNYALRQSPTGATTLNSPSGQAVLFSIGGSEKARVRYDGNFGIGTTNPGVALEVNGSSGMKLVNTGNNTVFLIPASSAFQIGTLTSKPFIFYTNNTEAGRFDTSQNFLPEGNVSGSATSTGSFGSLVVSDKVQGDLHIRDQVGIGRSPSSDYALQIQQPTGTNNNYIQGIQDNGSNTAFRIDTDSSDNVSLRLYHGAGGQIIHLNGGGTSTFSGTGGLEVIGKISGSATTTGSFGTIMNPVSNPVHLEFTAGQANFHNKGYGGKTLILGNQISVVGNNAGTTGFLYSSNSELFQIGVTSTEKIQIVGNNGSTLFAEFTGTYAISGSSTSTGSFGAVSIGKGTADNGRALTIVGNVQLNNNNYIYFKRSNGNADPHIAYDSSNNFKIFNPVSGEIQLMVGSAEIVAVDGGGLTFNGSKYLATHNSSGVITIQGNSGIKLKSSAAGGSGPIELIQGSTTYWSVGPEGNLTGSADLVMNAGKHISGSATSTGSFGHLKLDGAASATVTGHLVPSADGTYDLGTTNSQDWRNIYARQIDLANSQFIAEVGSSVVLFADHAAIGKGFRFTHRNTKLFEVGDSSNRPVISGSAISTGSFGRVQATSISASLYQGQIGSRYVHSQTSDSATWVINHNIGHKYPVVTVYDSSDEMILPETGTATDSDTFTLTFSEAIQGKAVVSVGGIGENAGANYIHTQAASSTNWRVTHSLSQQYPNVTVYDDTNQVIIPESITAASSNEMDITFSSGKTGYANFSIGSGIPNISAENAGKVLKVRSGGQGVEWSPTSNDVSGSMSVSGSITPTIDNFHNLGSATHRWANLHTGDIQLSNEGTEGNEVDGTTGSWTIQEGEDDLYLLNRKNGKKYKFKLEEIT